MCAHSRLIYVPLPSGITAHGTYKVVVQVMTTATAAHRKQRFVACHLPDKSAELVRSHGADSPFRLKSCTLYSQTHW